MTTSVFNHTNGSPFPYGATPLPSGINFSLTSFHAKTVTLCLFSPEQKDPCCEIELNPLLNKTGNVWHIFINDLPLTYHFAFRINQHNKFLLDPYAKSILTTTQWGNNHPYEPRCGIAVDNFDWEGVKAPGHALQDLVIYEMHVRAFTKHPSSKISQPGTYLGLIEKIPHLLDLGVNAVELLPIHEFNECEYTKHNPLTNEQLYNFWGYSTVNFFSPMQRYAQHSAINEFKAMVKALHANGIEVILDVVFNHTAEGGKNGPTLCFRGIENSIYYLTDKEAYLDFTGCGNTVNANHPWVIDLIRNSLRYWVTEMHVDGFRFDLTSALTRGKKGQPLACAPLIESISVDPILSQVKLIAEPWDAVGLYQVGSFSSTYGGRWSEWNGRYRDTVRRFIKGNGSKGSFVTNICGSQDFYHTYTPSCGINFLIAHDGFTLADLVSYNKKHNAANGEDNKDGSNMNDSWNCGVEGPTKDPLILHLRSRQMRNLHVALMISRGVPMIGMGDEYGHTKLGNNNTWCQDNDFNWFLWDEMQRHQEFYRFYRLMIQFRKENGLLRKNKFFKPEDIEWHGVKPCTPDWQHEDQVIAFTLKDPQESHDLYIVFNASPNAVAITFPSTRNQRVWHWVVNTSWDAPNDFTEGQAKPVQIDTFPMIPYSCIILKAF
ncbi:MAG: glycogen-debranching protein [Parachlamydiaceae bacterium]|nr:glycogen-debranching protein [Parachlamydiaceae bacterium]